MNQDRRYQFSDAAHCRANAGKLHIGHVLGGMLPVRDAIRANRDFSWVNRTDDQRMIYNTI